MWNLGGGDLSQKLNSKSAKVKVLHALVNLWRTMVKAKFKKENNDWVDLYGVTTLNTVGDRKCLTVTAKWFESITFARVVLGAFHHP